MKRKKTTTALWDFCPLFLSTFVVPIYTKIQAFIASCDTMIFCMVGFTFTYIIILAIRIIIETKHRH
jgi:hypothetical protein